MAQDKKIELNDGENTISFILSEDVNELQTVEITGRKQSSYKNDKSFSASKVEMELKISRNPYLR